MSIFLWIIVGVGVVVVLWVIGAYNHFVRLRHRAEEAESDIEVQLKRRFDLIPNVVETVKGYAKHENKTFENVARARSAAMQAEESGDKNAAVQAENFLTSTLKTLFAVSEDYPDLKADANFLELQRELADTENKVQASRRFYNGVVRDLNNEVVMFPTNIIANIFRVQKMEFFDLDDDDEAQEPVKVKF
jgi:LemA protein